MDEAGQDIGERKKLLPHRNTEGHTWDPEAMIHNARSLHAVAQHLVSDPDPGETRISDADGLFGTGRFFAGPVLLALATEIALKAWHCRETKGPPRRRHDLIALFEARSENTQRLLATRYPNHLFPRATEVFGPLPSDIRSALEIHKDTFLLWRYAEGHAGEVYRASHPRQSRASNPAMGRSPWAASGADFDDQVESD